MTDDADYGARWLADQVGVPISDAGRRVANLVNWVFDGIYHEQEAVMRARWDRSFVELTLSCDLSTFDSARLTRLVVGAHDHMIRIEIGPASPRYVRVRFHPRERYGNRSHRHPSIEEALAQMDRPLAVRLAEARPEPSSDDFEPSSSPLEMIDLEVVEGTDGIKRLVDRL